MNTVSRLFLMLMATVLWLGILNDSYAASTPTTTWAHVNGTHLRYQLSGQGQRAVVLLHENGMTLESWDSVVPELAKKYRVLRYDLRGFGLSQSIRGAFTMDDEVADLHELLSSLQLDRVQLVGSAIGGAIALQFAARYPEQVDQVIALTPAAYLQGNTAPPPQDGGAPPSTVDITEASYPTAMREADPERYRRYQAMQAIAGSGGAPTLAAIYAVKFAEVLPTLRVPAVIVATARWIRPVADYKALADAIPGGRFEVLDTGHFAPMASPELVNALLKRYLR